MRFLAAALVVVSLATPLYAASTDDRYSIMKPEPGARGTIWEPWLAPRYRSPRGTRQRVVTPRPEPEQPRRIPPMPPPVISPRTGQALPNVAPPVPGSGVGGRETFQDRASRCVHQGGMYGQRAGSNYVGTCINQ